MPEQTANKLALQVKTKAKRHLIKSWDSPNDVSGKRPESSIET
jgi:hypothetical protein